MGFALLGTVCYLGARHQAEEIKLIETDPNLQFRVEKSMQTVKYLTAYAIGCGVLSFMILLMWLF
jgi:hypothetical protein